MVVSSAIAVAAAAWGFRLMLVVVATQALLSAVPSLRRSMGLSETSMRPLALALCPMLGVALGVGVRSGVWVALHDLAATHRTSGNADDVDVDVETQGGFDGSPFAATTLGARVALSSRCAGIAGMSVVVSVTLLITVYVRFLQSSVLPWVFPSFWDPLPSEKKLKMVSLCQPRTLSVRQWVHG